MKCCVLMASPRKQGNTAELLAPFCDELIKLGWQVDTLYLYSMNLQPCRACRSCQIDHSIFGCAINDDMQTVFDSILQSDLIIFASPVYSWYCTPPLKSVLDRMVYGMNKFYGDIKGPALWQGKSAALISTCGYPIEKGADLLNEGIRRYCKHSKLNFLGMLAERHMGYTVPFMDEQKEQNAREFAKKLNNSMSN